MNGTSWPGASTPAISVKPVRTAWEDSSPPSAPSAARPPDRAAPRSRRTPRSRTGTAERLTTRPVTTSSPGPSAVTTRGVMPPSTTATGSSPTAGGSAATAAGARQGTETDQGEG